MEIDPDFEALFNDMVKRLTPMMERAGQIAEAAGKVGGPHAAAVALVASVAKQMDDDAGR